MTWDRLDDLRQREPGLNEFFSMLTSTPTADELAGERDAMTMFLTAASEESRPQPPTVRRSSARARLGGRLVAIATALALAGGFAAAGYAEALPEPLQRAVYEVFGWTGVPAPDNQPSQHPGSAGRTTPQQGRTATPRLSPQPSSSPRVSTSRSPRPGHSMQVLPVSLSVVPRYGGKWEFLLVACPRARRGDVVELEASLAGHWQILRLRRLHRNHRTAFLLRARKIGVTYRVVLLATPKHSESISNEVTIPARVRRTSRRRGRRAR